MNSDAQNSSQTYHLDKSSNTHQYREHVIQRKAPAYMIGNKIPPVSHFPLLEGSGKSAKPSSESIFKNRK